MTKAQKAKIITKILNQRYPKIKVPLTILPSTLSEEEIDKLS